MEVLDSSGWVRSLAQLRAPRGNDSWEPPMLSTSGIKGGSEAPTLYYLFI
jgi:hypothetical protein